MYGLAAICPQQNASIFSSDLWNYILHGCPTVTPIGVPPAPTGTALTLPPSSEADAQATVDAQLAAQLAAQQQLNAGGVQSSVIDQAASGAVSAGDAITNGPGGVSWLVWAAVGLGVFGVVALSAGSPRRYGR